MRRPTLHLGNDPPAGNHTQDSGASRTPFASTSPGACCLTGTSFRLRIILSLPRWRIRASTFVPIAARRQRLFSPPTEKNRPNLGNRRLNVPAVYIMPQLWHCQHAPSLPGRADTYPHPLISLMLFRCFFFRHAFPPATLLRRTLPSSQHLLSTS